MFNLHFASLLCWFSPLCLCGVDVFYPVGMNLMHSSGVQIMETLKSIHYVDSPGERKTAQMRNDMSDRGRTDHFHLIQSYSNNIIYYSPITFRDTDDWLRMGAKKPIKPHGWIPNTWSGEVKHNEVSWIAWLRGHEAADTAPQFQSRNLSVMSHSYLY